MELTQDDKMVRAYKFSYDEFRKYMIKGFPNKVIKDLRKFSYSIWRHDKTEEFSIIIHKWRTLKQREKAIKTYNKRKKEGGITNWWLRFTRGGY